MPVVQFLQKLLKISNLSYHRCIKFGVDLKLFAMLRRFAISFNACHVKNMCVANNEKRRKCVFLFFRYNKYGSTDIYAMFNVDVMASWEPATNTLGLILSRIDATEQSMCEYFNEDCGYIRFTVIHIYTTHPQPTSTRYCVVCRIHLLSVVLSLSLARSLM